MQPENSISPTVTPQLQTQPVVSPMDTPTTTQAVVSGPAYVGNSNIVDHSNQANIYPAVSQSNTSPPSLSQSSASSIEANGANSLVMQGAILLCGFLSSGSWIIAGYFSKSSIVGTIAALLLAAVAIFLAYRSHQKGQKMSPLIVVGLSGAAITLVVVADFYIAKAIIKSALSSVGY
ncbi:MAG TPA: hypothetical protein VFN31_01490 [Candidatus Saccharimonadales bacterium]|nr:hypothetical protein [Candidatus Saccharimonadales bacterium]